MSRLTRSLVVALLSAGLVGLEQLSHTMLRSFAFLILPLAMHGLGLGALVLRLVPAAEQPATPSVALTLAALVAPLGLVMSMPFPKGALRVGPLVDWGFAVNGAASVLGATAGVLVAFTWGFTAALIAAAALYLAAGHLLARA